MFLIQVARRCWAGNVHAKNAICKAMEENPLLKVTIPSHVEDLTLLEEALKPWTIGCPAALLLDCSKSPIFSLGFSRLVRFDRTPAILVCSNERNLGRVSELLRGAWMGNTLQVAFLPLQTKMAEVQSKRTSLVNPTEKIWDCEQSTLLWGTVSWVQPKEFVVVLRKWTVCLILAFCRVLAGALGRRREGGVLLELEKSPNCAKLRY